MARPRLVEDAINRMAGGPLMTCLASLSAGRPELRALTYMIPPVKLLEWASSIGVTRFPELARQVPPIPPVRLMDSVAEKEPELFLWTGLSDAHAILGLIDRHLLPELLRPAEVLDFGCGCARVARFLLPLADRLRLTGVDVNADHVNWCRAFLQGAEFELTPVEPPLRHPAQTFEVIYSVSVFTHLPVARIDRWLRELARLLHPEGIAIVTTHGEAAVERLARDAGVQHVLRLDGRAVLEISSRLATSGFCFFPYTDERLTNAGAGEDYGTLFAGEKWFAERAKGAGLSVVETARGGLRGWQDITVLRRGGGRWAGNPAGDLTDRSSG